MPTPAEIRLVIAMAKDWTDPVVVRDAPERVPFVIEQLIYQLEQAQAIMLAAHAWKDAKREFEAHLLSPKRDETRFITAGKALHIAEANLLAALASSSPGTGVVTDK